LFSGLHLLPVLPLLPDPLEVIIPRQGARRLFIARCAAGHPQFAGLRQHPLQLLVHRLRGVRKLASEAFQLLLIMRLGAFRGGVMAASRLREPVGDGRGLPPNPALRQAANDQDDHQPSHRAQARLPVSGGPRAKLPEQQRDQPQGDQPP